MEEKAFEYYKKYVLSNCTYGTDDIATQDVLQAMIEFAKEMCELQKQDCFKEFKNEFGSFVEIEKDLFINNCKNVCIT